MLRVEDINKDKYHVHEFAKFWVKFTDKKRGLEWTYWNYKLRSIEINDGENILYKWGENDRYYKLFLSKVPNLLMHEKILNS